MPPTLEGNQEELKKLLEENLAVAKDNNRLLREMRRNAILGLIVKAVLYLLLLGVPLLVLSSYIGPLLETFSGQTSTESVPASLLGIPSTEQFQQIYDQLQADYQ